VATIVVPTPIGADKWATASSFTVEAAVSTSLASEFGLPNDEALAHIALHGGSHQTIWFNFGTASNTRSADSTLRHLYGFSVMLLSAGASGVTLKISAGNTLGAPGATSTKEGTPT
jgi:hypothetical protein